MWEGQGGNGYNEVSLPLQSHEGQRSIPGTIPIPKELAVPGKWEGKHVSLKISYNTSIRCIYELEEVQREKKKGQQWNKKRKIIIKKYTWSASMLLCSVLLSLWLTSSSLFFIPAGNLTDTWPSLCLTLCLQSEPDGRNEGQSKAAKKIKEE